MTHSSCFSITQIALGFPLQFEPALGTKELDNLVNAYIPGNAPLQEKFCQLSLDFFATVGVSSLPGPVSRTYYVYTSEEFIAQSPLSLSSSPSSAQTPARSSISAASSPKQSKSNKRARGDATAAKSSSSKRLPGFSIMTKDGVDITEYASRGPKTKEQRDHAALMRRLKACPSCKRSKQKCDPSHHRPGAYGTISVSTTPSSIPGAATFPIPSTGSRASISPPTSLNESFSPLTRQSSGTGLVAHAGQRFSATSSPSSSIPTSNFSPFNVSMPEPSAPSFSGTSFSSAAYDDELLQLFDFAQGALDTGSDSFLNEDFALFSNDPYNGYFDFSAPSHTLGTYESPHVWPDYQASLNQNPQGVNQLDGQDATDHFVVSSQPQTQSHTRSRFNIDEWLDPSPHLVEPAGDGPLLDPDNYNFAFDQQLSPEGDRRRRVVFKQEHPKESKDVMNIMDSLPIESSSSSGIKVLRDSCKDFIPDHMDHQKYHVLARGTVDASGSLSAENHARDYYLISLPGHGGTSDTRLDNTDDSRRIMRVMRKLRSCDDCDQGPSWRRRDRLREYIISYRFLLNYPSGLGSGLGYSMNGADSLESQPRSTSFDTCLLKQTVRSLSEGTSGLNFNFGDNCGNPDDSQGVGTCEAVQVLSQYMRTFVLCVMITLDLWTSGSSSPTDYYHVDENYVLKTLFAYGLLTVFTLFSTSVLVEHAIPIFATLAQIGYKHMVNSSFIMNIMRSLSVMMTGAFVLPTLVGSWPQHVIVQSIAVRSFLMRHIKGSLILSPFQRAFPGGAQESLQTFLFSSAYEQWRSILSDMRRISDSLGNISTKRRIPRVSMF